MTPDITHDTVAAHLSQNFEGTLVPFDDENLSGLPDVAKIKKAYKLGALPSAPADQANGTVDKAKRQLELSVLGAIALRGAT